MRKTRYILELRYLRSHEKNAAWLLERLGPARLESWHARGQAETLRVRVRLTQEQARHLRGAADFEGVQAVILTRRPVLPPGFRGKNA